ncbi:MAG: hypothetical protein H0V89_05800 [Deltaproteobacteria bacterium]|nr:hypothetical protein [Deltaproteobacteria bacterium]
MTRLTTNTLSMDENETGGETDDGPSVSEYCVTGSSLQLHDTMGGTVVSASR